MNEILNAFTKMEIERWELREEDKRLRELLRSVRPAVMNGITTLDVLMEMLPKQILQKANVEFSLEHLRHALALLDEEMDDE